MNTSVFALARELSQLGPVLPVSGKLPMWKDWPNRATKDVNGDPEWAQATGVGLLTGHRAGYFVLDVDGTGGAETLAAWEREHEKLPATWVARTGSGGLHYFFRWPEFSVRGSAGKLGHGIDVRGEGGQVVAPGSRHPSGNLYRWESSPKDAELADAPGWLLEMLRPPPRVEPAPVVPVPDPDRAYQRARAYLAKVPGAISGSGGHDQTWKAALVVVRGFGLGGARGFDLLASEYNPRCEPPWSEKELRHKVESAARDASVPWGYLLDAQHAANVNTAVPRIAALHSEVKQPYSGSQDWPPLLRFDEVRVPTFPLKALPIWWRELVEDVAGFAQVRPDMPAMLSLASISTACAGRFHVEVRENYTEPLNLFVAVVMDSGDRKSSVFSECTKPLREVEAELLARARPEIAAAEQKRRSMDARLKHLQARIAKEDDEGTRIQSEAEAVRIAKELDALPPVLKPRLLADDVTPQALAILLQSCGEQIGVVAPEGGIFKTLGGRYSDGQADLDLVLKAYGGEPVTVDRVSRAPIRLTHPLVTFALTIQPKVLQDLAGVAGAIELGFAGRFLYALPGSDVGTRVAAAPAMRGEGAIEYGRKIRALLSGRIPGQATEAIRLSPEALAVRDSFHDEVEPRLKQGEGDLAVPGVKEWARKLVGTMARITGILHCAQHQNPAAEPVSGATAQAAVLICRYLVEHARAAFLTMGTDPEIERAKVALDWIRRSRCQRFTVRELYQSKRKSFDGKVTVLRQALELLTAHGYIRSVDQDRTGPGRPSEQYEVRGGI